MTATDAPLDAPLNAPLDALLLDRLPPHTVQRWGDLSLDWRQRLEGAIAPGLSPQYFLQPETEDQLAQILTQAHEHSQSVLICGSGSKLAWGDSAQTIHWVISTARLNRLIENATGDLTFTAEAGMTIAQAQAILAPHNLFLALDPAHPETATLGGIIATADAGSLRHRYGGVRDMLLGIHLVRADGQRSKAGGRVVKNVAGYDLMKLFTGSYGTLGVLTQVTLRTFPKPEALRTVLLSGKTDALAKLNLAIAQSNLNPIAQDWLLGEPGSGVEISQAAKGAITLALRFGNLEASVIEQAEEVRSLAQSLGLTACVLTDEPEQVFWTAQEERLSDRAKGAILCKFGLLPAIAAQTLQRIQELAPQSVVRLHGGSGLGVLRGSETDWGREPLEQLRSHCRLHSGFLTILTAPLPLKDQLDLWGYDGNALPVMQRLKDQFDPQKILNPGRFVVG